MENMGKYPFIFLDFKVRVFFLQFVQTTCLCVAEPYWHDLGRNALGVQRLCFHPLQGVERASHGVS